MEALSDLAWLLLNGGAFFVVMHYTANRHDTPVEAHNEAPNSPHLAATMARDPVCGMAVEPSNDISWIHHGLTYYFCSLSCRGRFRSAPQQFLGLRSVADPRRA